MPPPDACPAQVTTKLRLFTAGPQGERASEIGTSLQSGWLDGRRRRRRAAAAAPQQRSRAVGPPLRSCVGGNTTSLPGTKPTSGLPVSVSAIKCREDPCASHASGSHVSSSYASGAFIGFEIGGTHLRRIDLGQKGRLHARPRQVHGHISRKEQQMIRLRPPERGIEVRPRGTYVAKHRCHVHSAAPT